MQQLNLKSKELEPKRRRLEELEGKESLKEEDMKDFQQLTHFISEFERQWGLAENEYETYLKEQEREKMIENTENRTNFMQLAGLRDEIITENKTKEDTIKFLGNVLTLQTSDPTDVDDQTKEIMSTSAFYKIARLRKTIEGGMVDNMTLKLDKLNNAMDNIKLRIGQELTLVDGMNYKIYILNTDIVGNFYQET